MAGVRTSLILPGMFGMMTPALSAFFITPPRGTPVRNARAEPAAPV